MGLFRKSRHSQFELAELQADVVKLRDLAHDLTERLTRIETRPLPRPHPVTPQTLARVEQLAADALRSATIARADVAVRASNLDAVITDLAARNGAAHETLRAEIADLSATLGYQAAYLESHADQFAVSLQTRGGDAPVASTASDLLSNQTRIANDVARLTIELREEVAKLASLVRASEISRIYARPSGANGNGNGYANGNGNGNGNHSNGEEFGDEVTDTEGIDLRT